MRLMPKPTPRVFRVGPPDDQIELRDCANLELAPDEQVTFVTESGTEYDVVRKPWGYYATPSLNGRLPRHGLRPALVRGLDGKRYIMLVEKGKEREFHVYAKRFGHVVVCWLDEQAQLEKIEALLLAEGKA